VQVFLNYQGRTEMRYDHILTYDQDEHEKQFLYDNKSERTGLDSACKIINNELSIALKGTLLNGMTEFDNKLADFFNKKHEHAHEEIGTNVTKALSEAVLFATASCYQREEVFRGISENVTSHEFTKPLKFTKLLINLFNGGKLLGSAVKFAKFYLIIDGTEAKGDVDITESYLKFSFNLKKAV
jgi:hypothetical protein